MLFTIIFFLLLPKRVTKLSSFIYFEVLFLKYPFVVIEPMKRNWYRQLKKKSIHWLNYLLIHQSYVMWQSLDKCIRSHFDFRHKKNWTTDSFIIHYLFLVLPACAILYTCIVHVRARTFAEYSFHVYRRSAANFWTFDHAFNVPYEFNTFAV